MNLSKIGQFISRRRMAMGLTQAQLAERLNVTDKAVSKWERGKSLPDVTLFSRVAAELRVSVVELLSGELMNVVRSSNLDEAVDWDGKAAQATPLTLRRDDPADLLVSPYLFGCNLEHTRSCIYTGLSAQMVRNRKFAGKPTACEGCAIEWFPLGERGVFALDEPYTRHGEGYHMKRTLECNSVGIFNPYCGEAVGMGQHGITISQGQPYLFGMVVKTQESVKFTVSLTDRTGKNVYCCATSVGGGDDWTRLEVELTPQAADSDADLRICWENAGYVCVGAVSLLPKDHFHGMRRDVVEAMKDLGIKVLRWPGNSTGWTAFCRRICVRHSSLIWAWRLSLTPWATISARLIPMTLSPCVEKSVPSRLSPSTPVGTPPMRTPLGWNTATAMSQPPTENSEPVGVIKSLTMCSFGHWVTNSAMVTWRATTLLPGTVRSHWRTAKKCWRPHPVSACAPRDPILTRNGQNFQPSRLPGFLR